MGAVFREKNALPYETLTIRSPMAKADVNNIGAGRAAKGASPASSSKKQGWLFADLVFLLL